MMWKILERLSILAVLAAAGVVMHTAFSRPTAAPVEGTVPSAPISLVGLSLTGQEGARVGMIIISDFQCPYCGKFARDSWPTLRRDYVDSGRLAVGFWHLPLETIHPMAFKAAEAAECGARQGKFWEMHDRMFGVAMPGAGTVPALTDDSLREDAKNAGLDLTRFVACQSGEVSEKVRSTMAGSSALGIRSTPTFLIGQIKDARLTVKSVIRGAKPLSDFVRAIDDAVAGAGVQQR